MLGGRENLKGVDIDSIKVRDRQRKSLGDMEGLCNSIKKFGLINPITIDKELNLIAGERRLKACKLLKWNFVPVTYYDDLSPLERKEIELEENIRRKELDWQDEIVAKAELHQMKVNLHGVAMTGQVSGVGWTLKETADSLGESIGGVSMDIQVAKAIEDHPELKEEKNKTQAYNKYKRMIDNKIRSAIVESISEREPNGREHMHHLIPKDCREWLKSLKDESIDCIITDPPFGVDLDKSYDFKKKYEEVYAQSDSLAGWDLLLIKVLPELHRVLKSNGHLYIFFASRNQRIMEHRLGEGGFNYDPIPNIWWKGETAGTSYNPHQRFRANYEPFFFCWKDRPRPLKVPRGAVFHYPGVFGQNKVHPAEKPPDLGRELVSLSTIEGEIVLDPFCGVGSLLLPAYEMGRKIIGMELDKKYYDVFIERINKCG